MEEKKPQKIPEAYHKVTSKMFTNSLINIPLFAVPAFAALFVGKYLDNRYETEKTITLILLLIAFTTSWVLVLRNSRKLAREYKEMRKEMKPTEDQSSDKSV
jgi:hypothetical protein